MSTHFFYSVVVYDNGKLQINKNHIFKTVENIANKININLTTSTMMVSITDPP